MREKVHLGDYVRMLSKSSNAEALTFLNVFGSKKSQWYIMANLRVTVWIFKKFWLVR